MFNSLLQRFSEAIQLAIASSITGIRNNIQTLRLVRHKQIQFDWLET